jgi:hypothetical protein
VAVALTSPYLLALGGNGARSFQGSRENLLGDDPPFCQPHPWAADLAFWLREHDFVLAEERKGATL